MSFFKAKMTIFDIEFVNHILEGVVVYYHSYHYYYFSLNSVKYKMHFYTKIFYSPKIIQKMTANYR